MNWSPSPVKAWAARTAYQYTGGPDPRTLEEQYRVSEQIKRAQENFDRKIPYGAASIRTIYDLEKDEEMGKQGVAYVR